MNIEYIRVNENQYVVSDDEGKLKVVNNFKDEKSFINIENTENMLENVKNEIRRTPKYDEVELEEVKKKKKIDKIGLLIGTLLMGGISLYFINNPADPFWQFIILACTTIEEVIFLTQFIISQVKKNKEIKNMEYYINKSKQLNITKNNLEKELTLKKKNSKHSEGITILNINEENMIYANDIKSLRLTK